MSKQYPLIDSIAPDEDLIKYWLSDPPEPVSAILRRAADDVNNGNLAGTMQAIELLHTMAAFWGRKEKVVWKGAATDWTGFTFRFNDHDYRVRNRDESLRKTAWVVERHEDGGEWLWSGHANYEDLLEHYVNQIMGVDDAPKNS